MNTQHSPGPWAVAPSSNPKNGTDWRDIVGFGTASDFAPGEPFYIGEALENNAYLIAAAPDLLAALQTAQMCIMGYTHRNDVIENALAACHNAIAKATGSAS